LPRKRGRIKADDFRNSTDSQSHLLYDINESKSSTIAIANRRFSSDSSKNFRSNSFLNLSISSSDTASNNYVLNNPSLPTSPVRESYRKELPLLDFSTLPTYTQSILSPQPPSHSTKSNIPNATYDYQSSQLDFFLEEYRVLQKQLTKMQKTCNSLRKLESAIDTNAKLVELSDFSSDHLLLNTAAPYTATTPISNSNDDSIKGILKNKILLPGQPPEPPPYWLHRNAMLKRLNNQDYLPK
jgi:netrin-G1 ligand